LRIASRGLKRECASLAPTTKQNKWLGQILQVEGQLASSVTTQYDDDSAVIGSNKDYTRIHQLGGDAGRGKKVKIPARPYLQLTDDNFDEILSECKKYLSDNG
jgi:phage virion morphogenesis protein